MGTAALCHGIRPAGHYQAQPYQAQPYLTAPVFMYLTHFVPNYSSSFFFRIELSIHTVTSNINIISIQVHDRDTLLSSEPQVFVRFYFRTEVALRKSLSS